MLTYNLAVETADSSAGNPVLNIAVFGAFLVITMWVVLRAGKSTKEASDFYTGGGSFSGRQNGLAISGDYLSAASFLGIVGAVALTGYDGFLYSVGFFVAWLVALMLVAEPMRNVGRFTMADVFVLPPEAAPSSRGCGYLHAVCFSVLPHRSDGRCRLPGFRSVGHP